MDGEHIVGREPGVSIRLDSPKVSRHHARVTASGRAVSVEDLGSKNGTFVRGVRIGEPTRLEPGDDVQIGPIKLISGSSRGWVPPRPRCGARTLTELSRAAVVHWRSELA